MLLPNNRVYFIDLNELKSFYHAYQQCIILDQKQYNTVPTSFLEDLTAVVNYTNGRLSDKGLVAYCCNTPYEDGNTDDREVLLYRLYEELEMRIRRHIPSYRYCDDVVVTFENGWIYVLDRRRQVYVPDAAQSPRHQFTQGCGESTSDDVDWL